MNISNSLSHWICCLLAAAVAILSNPAIANASWGTSRGFDPIRLYGPSLDFDITRNGEKIGFHQVQFERSADTINVRARSEMTIDFLIFTAYRFRYDSNATWKDGSLISLNVDVDDNGEKLAFDATVSQGQFLVQSEKGKLSIDGPIFPTNHWNADVLDRTHVLNTLTANINNVTIRPHGQDEVQTERGLIQATRFVYNGDLVTEVWYDATGRWVKMRFQGRDGSTIEYICTKCQGGGTTKVLQ